MDSHFFTLLQAILRLILLCKAKGIRLLFYYELFTITYINSFG